MHTTRSTLISAWARIAARPIVAALVLVCAQAQADAVSTLRDFARDVKSARAAFSQTVTSPDGNKRKVSSGRFEFARPDRFRFVYAKPFEQQIVADGQRVWLYDVDLNQVTVRPMAQALGASPAALLAGGALERDFELSALPTSEGIEWAQALPRVKESSIQSMRVGFRAKQLTALEIVDAFGQRSMMRFTELESNLPLADELFRFVPPKGADLIQQ